MRFKIYPTRESHCRWSIPQFWILVVLNANNTLREPAKGNKLIQLNRGGACNYLHLKKISNKFKKSLFTQMYEEHPEYRDKKR